MALRVALAQLVQVAPLTLRPLDLRRRAPARRPDQRAQRGRDAVRVALAQDAEAEQRPARGLARVRVELAVLRHAHVDAPRREPRVEDALEGLDVRALHRRGREPEGARLLVGVLGQRAVVLLGAGGGAERDEALAQHGAQAVGLGAVRPNLRRQLGERRGDAGRGRRRALLGARDPGLDVLDRGLQLDERVLQPAQLAHGQGARARQELVHAGAARQQVVDDVVLAGVERVELREEVEGALLQRLGHRPHSS
jgi:hypothetical protein